MFQRTFIFEKTASSTSTLLKEAARRSRAPVYGVICAERQTAGRGRAGRSLFSPRGGIYFSASFPFEQADPRLPRFTLLAGLAVCKTLEPIAPLAVKWPNDVMLNGKKVCGILTETVFSNGAPTVILGVGINAALPAAEIPPELRDIMTSFAAEGLPAPAPRETVYAIVAALDREIYENRALSGDFAPYIAELEAHSFLTGKRVSRATENGTVSGIAVGLSAEGGLLVETDAAGTVEVTWGEVRIN